MSSALPVVFAVIALASGCLAQVVAYWQQLGTENLRTGASMGNPGVQSGGVSIWNGQHLVVFGGSNTVERVATGGFYDPTNDAWVSRPNFATAFGAPTGRIHAVMCWVDGKLIVYGGWGNGGPVSSYDNGGVYDFATDTWVYKPNLQNGTGAPYSIMLGLAAAVDGRVLVWGGHRREAIGFGSLYQGVYRGGLYDPVTDQWSLPSGLGSEMPPPQYCWSPLWTGTHIIARGGLGGGGNLQSVSNDRMFSAGGMFNVATDSWELLPVLGNESFPMQRANHSAAWSGILWLEFGGLNYSCPTCTNGVYVQGGMAYHPASDSWLALPGFSSPTLSPTERDLHHTVWTGSHLLVWGGGRFMASAPPTYNNVPQDADLYDPDTDTWLQDLALRQDVDGPEGRLYAACVWTGDRMIVWSGTGRPGGQPMNYTNGGVYVPPRVAPTVRNLRQPNVAGIGGVPANPIGDMGATATYPLKARVGQPFKHRIVCYGTPEAALISLDKPGWLNIGWGGPGPLLAAGTGQGNGGVGGAPPGTGAPFHPWYSSNGGTADGQWLRGTPDAAATGLRSFTIHAHNGIFPDSATYTVWIDVEGPPIFDDSSIFSPPPTTVAFTDTDYFYYPQAIASPAATYTATGLPAWAMWDGVSISGRPSASDAYTFTQITVTATNIHGSTNLSYYLTVLPPKPLTPGVADVNDDGMVNVLDVQKTVNIVLSLEPPSFIPHPTQPPPTMLRRGDVDGNGVVDVVDIQALVNAILGR